MFLFMSFSAKIQLRYFIIILVVIAVSVPIAWKYLMADYQKQRILCQLAPESDPLGFGYQQNQGKISIGSGGLWGQGLFKGPRVAHRNVVPVQESDFILSVAGEELGFIGCSLIMVLLLALLFRTLYIAYIAGETLGSYICFGFFAMILSQTIFNLGMCLSILPVIGVTLPFFSAGGSSAACLYLGIGLVQSIFLRKDDTSSENHISDVIR
jgi:rod shape determining protein RodA